jgi:hypothetical protein
MVLSFGGVELLCRRLRRHDRQRSNAIKKRKAKPDSPFPFKQTLL